MPLTKPYETYERPGLMMSYKAGSVRIFKGALLGTNSQGLAEPLDPAVSGLRYIGVASDSVDPAAAPNPKLNVSKSASVVMRPAAGYVPSQADVGLEVYAASDSEVQVASTGLANAYKVGTITALEGTSTGQSGVRIRIDRHTS